MPKATLSYTLPEEKEEFETALHGGDYKCAWSDLREALRGEFKYKGKKQITAELLYEMLNQIEENYDIKY